MTRMRSMGSDQIGGGKKRPRVHFELRKSDMERLSSPLLVATTQNAGISYPSMRPVYATRTTRYAKPKGLSDFRILVLSANIPDASECLVLAYCRILE